MKVVLRAEVGQLGRRGDICDVADGYAQNYLIPKGLAIKANSGSMRAAESMRRARELQDIRRTEEAREMAARLGDRAITISARASEAGRLFGSVSAQILCTAIAEQTRVKLDTAVLNLSEPIKQTGTHTVRAILHPEVSVDVTVEVSAY